MSFGSLRTWVMGVPAKVSFQSAQPFAAAKPHSYHSCLEGLHGCPGPKPPQQCLAPACPTKAGQVTLSIVMAVPAAHVYSGPEHACTSQHFCDFVHIPIGWREDRCSENSAWGT